MKAGIVPPCEVEWPDYGSDGYVKKMEMTENLTFEIALSIRHLKFSCFFDENNFFGKELNSFFMLKSERDSVGILASGFVVHVQFNDD